jgi:tRNA (adenine22-N1)-methyltransferase
VPTLVRLSARLEAIASFVVSGRPMADVGTDHARLPAALVERGVVPRAIASDVGAGPLEAARRTALESNTLDRIELRHSDGLSHLGVGEVATIVIAGMGGGTIVEILRGAPPAGVERLVLAPNTGVASVRRHLGEAGFDLVDECVVEEDGRFYPVLVAEPAASPAPLSERDIELGPHLRVRGGEAFRGWARHELARARRTLQGLAQAREPDPDKLDRTRRRLGWLEQAARGT